MKKFIIPILLLAFIACNNETNSGTDTETDATVVTDFINDVESLEMVDSKTPIPFFEENAKNIADEVMGITKNNIQDFLDKAKTYNHCVIVVEDHTILNVLDFNDCKQSGSWGACMPMAEGYIKKGDLDYQEDYINNIIGLPDSQTRTAYLFK